MFGFSKLFIFICGFSPKVIAHFWLIRNNGEIVRIQQIFESNKLNFFNTFDQFAVLSKRALQLLLGGSIEIRLTVPIIKS